jgi:hypothetical protein
MTATRMQQIVRRLCDVVDERTVTAVNDMQLK